MDADLIEIRLIACSNTDQDEADAIGHRRDLVAIVQLLGPERFR